MWLQHAGRVTVDIFRGNGIVGWTHRSLLEVVGPTSFYGKAGVSIQPRLTRLIGKLGTTETLYSTDSGR